MRAEEALKKDVDKTAFRIPTFVTAVSRERERGGAKSKVKKQRFRGAYITHALDKEFDKTNAAQAK